MQMRAKARICLSEPGCERVTDLNFLSFPTPEEKKEST